ncbi:MAG: META domain-containing protein [Henriciella sp.]|uniref:META domain-containing protein n=1 Tax=Henriciella sp. TaxID=1968823 RepID=UPI0032ECBA22
MKTAAALIAACLVLSGCVTQEDSADVPAASSGPASEEATETAEAKIATAPQAHAMRVVGSLVYEQNIPLPVDAVATLSLWEDGLPMSVREPVQSAQFDLNGRQVPIPFEVDVENLLTVRGHAMRLDVVISDGEGTPLWTNQSSSQFETRTGLINLGAVRLHPEPSVIVDMAELAGKDWLVARLDGEPLMQTTRATIRFNEEGRISGNASCNAYTGSFKLNAGQLTIAPLALTRKACVPQLMEQEQAFISVLQSVTQVRIDETGLLVLQNSEGGRITARQGG